MLTKTDRVFASPFSTFLAILLGIAALTFLAINVFANSNNSDEFEPSANLQTNREVAIKSYGYNGSDYYDFAFAQKQQSIGLPQISLASPISGFTSPVHITHAGDASGRLFVVEQPGRIRIVKNGQLLTTPFLDISNRVNSTTRSGMMSAAFPPGYASKGYFYVYYININNQPEIARYRITNNPDIADSNNEQIVLTITATAINHVGGTIAFNPRDGYLYFALGDGEVGARNEPGDPENRAQNPNDLRGKMLRIDTETGNPVTYTIPPTNPFVNTPGYRGEIWALGFRNPWRFSFDRQTHDIFLGDNGQDTYEEVDFQPGNSTGGENYGWRIMEGNHCYNPPTGCSTSGLTLPVYEYARTGNCSSVIGGHVYRGNTYQRMQGIYFYGDYCNGRISGLRRVNGVWENSVLLDTGFNYGLVSFGEDEPGNLFIAHNGNGTIYKIVDNSPTASFASISGNVLSGQTSGMTRITVTLTDMQGNARSVLADKRGAFSFREVRVGETYVLNASARKYTYVPKVITVAEDIRGINISPQ